MEPGQRSSRAALCQLRDFLTQSQHEMMCLDSLSHMLCSLAYSSKCHTVPQGAHWLAGMGPKYGKAKYGGTTAQGHPSEHHYPTTPVAGAAGAGCSSCLYSPGCRCSLCRCCACLSAFRRLKLSMLCYAVFAAVFGTKIAKVGCACSLLSRMKA